MNLFAAVRRYVALFLYCGLAACSFQPYRIDIQQGNVITQEQIAALKVGMSKEQVRYLLGTPLLTDIFHQHRWDFVYRFEKGSTRALDSRQLVVFFGPDAKVEKIQIDLGSSASDAQGGKTEKPRVYDLAAPVKIN